MAIIDIIILIIVGIAGFSCYKAGFTRSVWGIFAIGAGLIVASQLWQPLAVTLQKLIANEQITKWISILALIIITAIVVDKLFSRVHSIIEKGILGWLDSLLGLGIGIASSALIIALLLNAMDTYIGDSFKSVVEDSLLAAPLMELGHEVWIFGKENVKKHLESE